MALSALAAALAFALQATPTSAALVDKKRRMLNGDGASAAGARP
jgi:hypothetical protein